MSDTGHTHCGKCGEWVKNIGGHTREPESAEALAREISHKAFGYTSHDYAILGLHGHAILGRVVALIKADRDRVRRQALEDACKAMCDDCDSGTEVFWDACMQEWAHDLGPAAADPKPHIVTCEANDIRRVLMEEPDDQL